MPNPTRNIVGPRTFQRFS